MGINFRGSSQKKSTNIYKTIGTDWIFELSYEINAQCELSNCLFPCHFFPNKILHRISDFREKFSRIRGRSFSQRKFLPSNYFHGKSKKMMIYINFLLLSLSQHLHQFKLFHIIFSSPMWFYMDKDFS